VRKFVGNRRDTLKWQRLGPFGALAGMIDGHWDGIASVCRPGHTIPLGFVDGLNTKIRVLQRRAYGLCDENHLRLKILTCMLPPI
jgi:transposase